MLNLVVGSLLILVSTFSFGRGLYYLAKAELAQLLLLLLHYKVADIHIIDSDQHPNLFPPANALLMVTCYPFDALGDSGSLRYVVVSRPSN